jgi:hypothetical protein
VLDRSSKPTGVLEGLNLTESDKPRVLAFPLSVR